MSSVESVKDIKTQIEEVKDFVSLLKPGVMSLVVFTGLCGMLVAPGNIHPLIAIVSIICLTIGSGASGAINMWYERDIDGKMKRTQNRPLPRGRINPQTALDFAGVLAFVSVFIMAAAVNIMAAFLLLCGILFYVFVYTIWLKPRTPQNIVIGGAAGAFPPMIGWASVTGDVSTMSIVMFLITFLWTPPHFWALAIYKNTDYQNAGIPMMPAVYGVTETKKQMLLYTIALFVITLVPFFIGFSGYLYLVTAILMGGKFLHHAYKVYKDPHEKKCKSMFLFSILYLFVIFLGLVIDSFIVQ